MKSSVTATDFEISLKSLDDLTTDNHASTVGTSLYLNLQVRLCDDQNDHQGDDKP